MVKQFVTHIRFKKNIYLKASWCKSIVFLTYRKNVQKRTIKDDFGQILWSDLLLCSFIMSDPSELLSAALLKWATWAICSRSLFSKVFWLERPERFAHSRLVVLMDLSKSLTVWAIWATWAIERWANKRIPNPVANTYTIPKNNPKLSMKPKLS